MAGRAAAHANFYPERRPASASPAVRPSASTACSQGDSQHVERRPGASTCRCFDAGRLKAEYRRSGAEARRSDRRLQRHGAARGARGGRPARAPALARPAARRRRRARCRPPNKPTPSPSSATAPGSPATSPCSTPRPRCSPRAASASTCWPTAPLARVALLVALGGHVCRSPPDEFARLRQPTRPTDAQGKRRRGLLLLAAVVLVAGVAVVRLLVPARALVRVDRGRVRRRHHRAGHRRDRRHRAHHPSARDRHRGCRPGADRVRPGRRADRDGRGARRPRRAPCGRCAARIRRPSALRAQIAAREIELGRARATTTRGAQSIAAGGAVSAEELAHARESVAGARGGAAAPRARN